MRGLNGFATITLLAMTAAMAACGPTPGDREIEASSGELAQSSPQATNPETLFDRALDRTETQDWQGAIADLKEAAAGFAQQGDERRQAMAEAIVRYLDWWLGWTEQQREGVEGGVMPDWQSFGRCLEDASGQICGYALQFAQSEDDQIEGVLLLQKHLEDVPTPGGGSYPVFAIVDAEVVYPPLGAGESWTPTCERLDGESSPGMMAIVTSGGYEDSEYYPEVREVWWANVEEESLQSQRSGDAVRCFNPCPGGC